MSQAPARSHISCTQVPPRILSNRLGEIGFAFSRRGLRVHPRDIRFPWQPDRMKPLKLCHVMFEISMKGFCYDIHKCYVTIFFLFVLLIIIIKYHIGYILSLAIFFKKGLHSLWYMRPLSWIGWHFNHKIKNSFALRQINIHFLFLTCEASQKHSEWLTKLADTSHDTWKH